MRGVRLDTNASYRKIPILFMTSDTRISIVKAARDAGANMIITKPLSPKGLYDRLAWVAFDTRAFAESKTYYGPDRRFKIEGFPDGQGRRKGDLPVEIGADSGPGLSQNEIELAVCGRSEHVKNQKFQYLAVKIAKLTICAHVCIE